MIVGEIFEVIGLTQRVKLRNRFGVLKVYERNTGYTVDEFADKEVMLIFSENEDEITISI